MARRIESLPHAMVSLESQVAGSSPQYPVPAQALAIHLRCPTCAIIPLAHEVLEGAVEAQWLALQESAVTIGEMQEELDRLRNRTPLDTQLEAADAAARMDTLTRERDALLCRQDEMTAQLNAAEFQLAERTRQLIEAETGRAIALVKLQAYRRYVPEEPK